MDSTFPLEPIEDVITRLPELFNLNPYTGWFGQDSDLPMTMIDDRPMPNCGCGMTCRIVDKVGTVFFADPYRPDFMDLAARTLGIDVADVDEYVAGFDTTIRPEDEPSDYGDSPFFLQGQHDRLVAIAMRGDDSAPDTEG